MNKTAIIYSDGSCHTQLKIGAWAALLFIENEKITLQGIEYDTTHNRMELQSVIESLKYLQINYPEYNIVRIISDSQYVVLLRERKQKLIFKNFETKAGKEIQNIDLVKELFSLDTYFHISYEKIKAHQPKIEGVLNFNIDVDLIARDLLRKEIGEQ